MLSSCARKQQMLRSFVRIALVESRPPVKSDQQNWFVIIACRSLRWKSPNSEDMTLVSLMAPMALSNSLLTCSSLNHTHCYSPLTVILSASLLFSHGFLLHCFLTRYFWAHWNSVRIRQLWPLKSLLLVIHKNTRWAYSNIVISGQERLPNRFPCVLAQLPQCSQKFSWFMLGVV